MQELFQEAIASRASDIHIEPQQDCVRVRFRVDGYLVPIRTFPPAYASPLISRIKILSKLDIAEKRLPQDGSLRIEDGEHKVEMRVSTLPTLHGEKVVLRLFHQEQEPIRIDQLGMEADQELLVKRWLNRTSGLVIVTGPTGSGKTTTLYAMIQAINRPEMNIVTLEDPVESQLPGVNQVQIHPKSGLHFVQGLRAILRQDPNVIMIGEIRDVETANIAIRAALSGHLVLTSLHTVDGASAVTRLLDMNIEPYRVAAALTGVIAQRLVRLICPHCQGERCHACQHTGYYGRTGAFEVLEMDEEAKRSIMQNISLSDLRCLFRSKGLRTLQQTVMKKVNRRLTTVEEWTRVVDSVEEELVER